MVWFLGKLEGPASGSGSRDLRERLKEVLSFLEATHEGRAVTKYEPRLKAVSQDLQG